MTLSPWEIVWAVAAGMALGGFYFGSLWWILRLLPQSRHPAGLIFGSFLVRTVLAVAGFYFVMAGEWSRLLFCLGGFLIARVLLLRRLGPRARPGVSMQRNGSWTR